MKPFTKQLIAGFAALLLMLAACKKDAPEITPASNTSITLPIFGNWKSVSYEKFWYTSPIGGAPYEAYSSGLDSGLLEIQLNADSTYLLWSADTSMANDAGTYFYHNGQLKMDENSWNIYEGYIITQVNDSSLFIDLWGDFPYTVNDTGSTPDLYDYASAHCKYQFKRQ
jgi:hypothetical protein